MTFKIKTTKRLCGVNYIYSNEDDCVSCYLCVSCESVNPQQKQWKLFCVAWPHGEGFPITTESALWLADTESKLHAAFARLEDATGCSGELKLIWTAFSVKRNPDSVCNLFPIAWVDDFVVKCAFRTVKQPAGNYLTPVGLSAFNFFQLLILF